MYFLIGFQWHIGAAIVTSESPDTGREWMVYQGTPCGIVGNFEWSQPFPAYTSESCLMRELRSGIVDRNVKY